MQGTLKGMGLEGRDEGGGSGGGTSGNGLIILRYLYVLTRFHKSRHMIEYQQDAETQDPANPGTKPRLWMFKR